MCVCDTKFPTFVVIVIVHQTSLLLRPYLRNRNKRPLLPLIFFCS